MDTSCHLAEAYLDVGDCQWVGESLQQSFVVAAKGHAARAQQGGQAKCMAARLHCVSVCHLTLMQLPSKAKLRKHCTASGQQPRRPVHLLLMSSC